MRATNRIARQRKKRSFRVRNGIRANSGRVRLSIFRSNKHVYAQLIDDTQGITIASASTMQKGVIGDDESGGNIAAAQKVGQIIAARAKEKGITEVVFDRGPSRYHGRVAALAEAAREAGLDF